MTRRTHERLSEAGWRRRLRTEATGILWRPAAPWERDRVDGAELWGLPDAAQKNRPVQTKEPMPSIPTAGGPAAGEWRGWPLSRDGGDDDRVGRGWFALRYEQSFYGLGTHDEPGSGHAVGGADPQASVPDRIGDGGGVSWRVHIDDAAAATAVAVDQGRPGIYYIVENDPAPVRESLRGR